MTATLSEWHERWMGHYEYARDEGADRDAAADAANRLTEEELGPRPVEEL